MILRRYELCATGESRVNRGNGETQDHRHGRSQSRTPCATQPTVSTDIVPTPTQAQDKKDKGKPKETKKAGTIEIAAGKGEKFRFFVRDSEGKLLAMSGPGGFATEKDAEKAVETLKEVIASQGFHQEKRYQEKREVGQTRPPDTYGTVSVPTP